MFSQLSFAPIVEKDTKPIVEKDTKPIVEKDIHPLTLDYESLVYQHFHDETL
jgi:hypothetical protein